MKIWKTLVFALIWLTPIVAASQDTQPTTPAPVPLESTYNPIGLKISGNLEICKGAETILKAEGNFESYTWSKGATSGQYLKVSEEGVYEVTARTKGGCTYTASVTVRFRPCPV